MSIDLRPARLVQGPGMREGLTTRQQFLLYAVLLLLIFSRRPGDLLHAQFYAEDGARWFQQAYNFGWWRALPIPDASYLQVLPRLSAAVALLFPLRWAPLVMNVAGATVQAAPALALLSRRCSAWGTLPERTALAALFLANPNATEIHITITHAQWHLALLELLLAMGTPPRTVAGKAFDVFVFLLGSVSGPFGLVILPLLLVSWWFRRERWTLAQAGCLAFGAIFQVRTLLTGTPFRLPVNAIQFSRTQVASIPLGATPALFVRLTGGEVFLAGLTGHFNPARVPFFIPLLFMIFGFFIVACGLVYGGRPFRFFAVFAIALFAAGLKAPVILDPTSRWHALTQDAGMRYFFPPTLLFLWSLAYVVSRSRWKPARFSAIAALFLLLIGLARWKHANYPDHHYADFVTRFQQAAPGEAVSTEIQPVPWTMTLVKH